MVERFMVYLTDEDTMKNEVVSSGHYDGMEAAWRNACERGDKAVARLAEVQEEADRRTREIEACYTVQRDLKARLAEAEALLREARRDLFNPELIEEVFGPRCSEFDPGCICCRAWLWADDAEAFLDAPDSATHREDDSHE